VQNGRQHVQASRISIKLVLSGVNRVLLGLTSRGCVVGDGVLCAPWQRGPCKRKTQCSERFAETPSPTSLSSPEKICVSSAGIAAKASAGSIAGGKVRGPHNAQGAHAACPHPSVRCCSRLSSCRPKHDVAAQHVLGASQHRGPLVLQAPGVGVVFKGAAGRDTQQQSEVWAEQHRPPAGRTQPRFLLQPRDVRLGVSSCSPTLNSCSWVCGPGTSHCHNAPSHAPSKGIAVQRGAQSRDARARNAASTRPPTHTHTPVFPVQVQEGQSRLRRHRGHHAVAGAWGWR
jgi:hypothetical protein